MPGPDGLSSPAEVIGWRPHDAGDRLLPARDVARCFGDGTLPHDVLTFHAGGAEPAVICCPLTSVPLTIKMARASGVSYQQLQSMVGRSAPLGAKSVAQWKLLEGELTARLPEICAPGGRRLGDGEIRIVVAGSGVGCFHSVSTTRERGRFPADETELESRVRGSALHRNATPQDLDEIVASAKLRYRSLNLGDRVPVAPWFSVLHYLHIEEPSDADIRIVSAVVDDVMLERSRTDRRVGEWTGRDRLNRWNRDHVYELFPEVEQLSSDLQRFADVGLGFLSPQSGALIDTRPDWWRLYDNR